MSEWDFLLKADWSWAYSAKMLVTLGILAVWWGLSLWLGSRIREQIGGR